MPFAAPVVAPILGLAARRREESKRTYGVNKNPSQADIEGSLRPDYERRVAAERAARRGNPDLADISGLVRQLPRPSDAQQGNQYQDLIDRLRAASTSVPTAGWQNVNVARRAERQASLQYDPTIRQLRRAAAQAEAAAPLAARDVGGWYGQAGAQAREARDDSQQFNRRILRDYSRAMRGAGRAAGLSGDARAALAAGGGIGARAAADVAAIQNRGLDQMIGAIGAEGAFQQSQTRAQMDNQAQELAARLRDTIAQRAAAEAEAFDTLSHRQRQALADDFGRQLQAIQTEAGLREAGSPQVSPLDEANAAHQAVQMAREAIANGVDGPTARNEAYQLVKDSPYAAQLFLQQIPYVNERTVQRQQQRQFDLARRTQELERK